MTTCNSTILGKLDSFGVEHDKVLLNAKKTITLENSFVESLNRKREECLSTKKIIEASSISKDTSTLLKTCHPGFVVAFDNIDIAMKRRNTTVADQNHDYHWVNHKMVVNRVGANDMPTKPLADILDVENIKFLPNFSDSERQRMDYIILTSRIICNYFDALEPIKDVCIHHIPHKYSKEMSGKSQKVINPLNIFTWITI